MRSHVPPDSKMTVHTRAIAAAVSLGEVRVTRSRRPTAPIGSSIASETVTCSRSSPPRSEDRTERRTWAGMTSVGQSSSTQTTRWPLIVI